MNPLTLLKLGTYAAAATFGGVLVYFVYASPRIDSLEKREAQATAAAQKEKSDFLEAAAAKQKELQDAVDKANQDAVDAAKARSVAAANAAAADKRLRDYIASSIATIGPKLSTTPEGAISNSTAAAGWVLAGQLDTYSSGCAAEADRLGDAVRYYEQALGIKR